jgi:hypothetical protein
MPAFLIPILINIGQFLWHAVCRFWSVFLVGAIILVIVLAFNGWKLKQYDLGYHNGYSQALTDHPTYVVGSGGTVNNNVLNYKYFGMGLQIWKFRTQAGV